MHAHVHMWRVGGGGGGWGGGDGKIASSDNERPAQLFPPLPVRVYSLVPDLGQVLALAGLIFV